MNRDELQTAAIALLRSAVSWQSGLARLLKIEVRTVRRWVSENATPEWVEAEIGKLMGAQDALPYPRDEWLIGEAVTADGRNREYIVHLAPPRFAARIVVTDPYGIPIPSEMPADTMNGTVYQIDDETILCEVAFFDDVTPAEITQLMEAACNAIDQEAENR